MAEFGIEDPGFRKLLADARSGDASAVGSLLDEYRDYLLLIANQQIDRKIQGKVGGSDIVQESMLAAQQGFSQFEGDTPEQLMAWLRQILLHDVYEVGRHYKKTAKRHVDREVPLTHEFKAISPIVDPKNTPKTDALIREDASRLREAMQQLPADYRRVLELRNWEQLTFAQVGEQMDRSEDAARKLWTRAILHLQQMIC